MIPKRAPAVERVHGAVERLMGAAQIGRHEVGVVEVGQRRRRCEKGAGGERVGTNATEERAIAEPLPSRSSTCPVKRIRGRVVRF